MDKIHIYLDVCCLSRPFDDQTQERIHLESEAVIAILKYVRSGKWDLFSSDFVNMEISIIPDVDRRRKVQYLSKIAHRIIEVDEGIIIRQAVLEKFGFKPLDAFHIAAAEKGEVDVLLTTDDELMKQYRRNKKAIKIRMENPAQFMMEAIFK